MVQLHYSSILAWWCISFGHEFVVSRDRRGSTRAKPEYSKNCIGVFCLRDYRIRPWRDIQY